jgi:glycosyltransferase involved in cell wall biosynthesis
LVLLVHLPLEDDREAAVIAAVRAVITTSEWTRRRLLAHYDLAAHTVRAAAPGVDRALPAPGTTDCGELLCVGAVAPHKGQDCLLDALAGLRDEPWRLSLVGPLDRDPAFVAELCRGIEHAGLADRVRLPGPLTGAALDRAYAGADLLVLPSRGETYGMVVTEALARALPVVATDVGGVSEALGFAPDGARPGLLVPPDDAPALADAVRRWLSDADLRTTLRAAAARRRETLSGWRETAERVERVLREVAA